MTDKAPDAFRTISEAAEELDLQQHVLRFWETRFTQIKPLKRGGGRRYYRPDDMEFLRGLKHLLHGERYTIKGVQKIIKESGVKAVQNAWKEGVRIETPPSIAKRAQPADSATNTAPVPVVIQKPVPGNAESLLRAALAELQECRRLLKAGVAA